MGKKVWLALLLLLIPNTIFAQTIVCYNETVDGNTVKVCNVTSDFLEEHTNDLSYLQAVQNTILKEEHSSDLQHLFAIFTSTLKEIHSSNLAHLSAILESHWLEAHYNPNITIPGYAITPGQIQIITERAQLGDNVIEYQLAFPEYSPVYEYKVICYLNGTSVYTKTYEDVEPASNLTDYCIVPILEKGYHNITVEFYAIYTAQHPPIETLLDTDSKIIEVVHYPFELVIEEPQNQTYKEVEIEAIYSIKTAPTSGITYILESILMKGNETVWSANDTIPAGIIGTYSYTLTFGQAGTYTLYAKLYALYNNTTLVDEVSDNVTFTISEDAFEGPGGGVPSPPEGITSPPPATVTEEPKLEVTENITHVPTEEEQPTGVQSVIEVFRQRPWLIILVIILVAFMIMLSRR